MTDTLSNLVLWCLMHQPTIQAIAITALLAFVAGAAWQFCIDDKKKDADRSAIR